MYLCIRYLCIISVLSLYYLRIISVLYLYYLCIISVLSLYYMCIISVLSLYYLNIICPLENGMESENNSVDSDEMDYEARQELDAAFYSQLTGRNILQAVNHVMLLVVMSLVTYVIVVMSLVTSSYHRSLSRMNIFAFFINI